MDPGTPDPPPPCLPLQAAGRMEAEHHAMLASARASAEERIESDRRQLGARLQVTLASKCPSL